MSGDDLPQLDTRHAHPARVYNYWLGGKDNFAADREAAEQAIAANPGIKTDVRANRAFLTRVVRYLAGECGVRQFLDIGTGLPVAEHASGGAGGRPGRADRVRRQRSHRAAARPGPAEQPGVVQPQQWRPEPGTLSPPQVTAWCGVARKR